MQKNLKIFLSSIFVVASISISAQTPVLIKDGSLPNQGLVMTQLTGANGLLFFCGDDQINPHQLYRSNGSSAGTYMVKEIKLDNWYNEAGYPYKLIEANNLLFFNQ